MSNPIAQTSILVVEGTDEENFFSAYVKHLGLDERALLIIKSEGKDNLYKAFNELMATSAFDGVKRIGIIQDADRSSIDRFRSIYNFVKKQVHPVTKQSLTPPEASGEISHGMPAIGIFLLPDCKSNGMLETVCLNIVNNSPIMECVEGYIKCLETRLPDKQDFPKNIEKSKVQAYLAGKPDDVHSIGIAAQKGYWDFAHKSLEPLKDFLIRLFGQSNNKHN